MFYLYEEQILEAVKKIIERYKKNLYLVVIYGSFSRQQHMPDSDLDILIVGDEEIKKIILDELAEIYVKYSVMISALFYSLKQYQMIKHHPFITTALREGIIIWEKRKI